MLSASAPVIDACMLNTSAVAPLPPAPARMPTGRSPRSRAQAAVAARGVNSPNIPAVRRSSKSAATTSADTAFVLGRTCRQLRPQPSAADLVRNGQITLPHDAPRSDRARAVDRSAARSTAATPAATNHRNSCPAAGRMPVPVRLTPLRARLVARISAGGTNSFGSWMPFGARPGIRSERRHHDEPRSQRGVDSVEHRDTAGTAGHGRPLLDHCGRIGDVLEDFTGADRVHRLVGQRNRVHIREYRNHARSRLAQRHRDEVEADVAVAECLGRAAREGQHRSRGRQHRPGRGPVESAPRGRGYPMQHRESAVRSATTRRRASSYLSDVVAQRCERHTTKCYTQGDDRAHSARYWIDIALRPGMRRTARTWTGVRKPAVLEPGVQPGG